MHKRLRSARSDDPPPHPRIAGQLLLVASILLLPRDANAYIDAGTGSMIIQAMIASAAAGMVVLRRYRARIKAFFRRSSPKPGAASEAHDD